MFASLKNKIREETGNDLSKLTAKITSSTVQRIDSLKGRSRQGSTSSINSLVSSDGLDNEELRKRLTKIEADFNKKLDQKEAEFREILAEKDKQLENLEKEKEAIRQRLKNAEEFKQKLVEHQEDKEQFESFQNQELAKVKHLVLQREQELAEKTNALKEATNQLEKLRNEVNRLRRQEELLSDVQDDLESLRHSSARDLASLATQLAKSEEDRRHLNDLIVVLRQRVANETSDDEHIASERKLLEQRLEEAHLHLADIKTSWSDKIASLETQVYWKNIQDFVPQVLVQYRVGRLSRQAAEEGSERRRAVQEKQILFERVKQMEAELDCNRLELNNKETKIKRLETDLEELTNELKILKMENDEEITFLRTQLQNANTEVKIVRKNLENTENELDKSEDECSKLKISVDSEHQTNTSLRQLITKLEKELNEEKTNSLNVQKTLTRVTSEKNTALLRNAEISQQMELIKQDKRRQECEMNELLNKLTQLEEENKKHNENKNLEQQLKNNINELEEQITEKNKNIKTLQLRLADMKKTLQQELNHYHNNYDNENSAAILTPSQVSTRNYQLNNLNKNDNNDVDDVNFKYLKHVVIKFMTSKEYEAQHLIKAISTVLKFSPDEEKLVNDTLEWKRSWFGTKPKITTNKSRMTSS